MINATSFVKTFRNTNAAHLAFSTPRAQCITTDHHRLEFPLTQQTILAMAKSLQFTLWGQKCERLVAVNGLCCHWSIYHGDC